MKTMVFLGERSLLDREKLVFDHQAKGMLCSKSLLGMLGIDFGKKE